MATTYEPPTTVRIVNDRVAGRDGDIAVRGYTPVRADASTAPVIWLHGGAFVGGGLDQLESHAVAAELAATGLTVLTVQYRLAPRINWLHPRPRRVGGDRFPAALHDVVDVIDAVTTDREPYSLGGASAGACLAASAAITLRAQTLSAAPARLALAYGTFHAALPAMQPELRKRVSGRHALGQFTPRAVQIMNDNYVGADARFAPEGAFPGDAFSLSNLPPILLLDADRDVLRASGARFGDQLREAGAQVDQFVVPESRHGFLDRPQTQSFTKEVQRLAAWLKG